MERQKQERINKWRGEEISAENAPRAKKERKDHPFIICKTKVFVMTRKLPKGKDQEKVANQAVVKDCL